MYIYYIPHHCIGYGLGRDVDDHDIEKDDIIVRSFVVVVAVAVAVAVVVVVVVLLLLALGVVIPNEMMNPKPQIFDWLHVYLI